MDNNNKLYVVAGQVVHLTNGQMVSPEKMPLSNYFYTRADAETYMRRLIEERLPDDCTEFYAFVDEKHPGGISVPKEEAIRPVPNPEGVSGVTFYAKRKCGSVVYVMAEVCELVPREID